jgi:hypothetical protein
MRLLYRSKRGHEEMSFADWHGLRSLRELFPFGAVTPIGVYQWRLAVSPVSLLTGLLQNSYTRLTICGAAWCLIGGESPEHSGRLGHGLQF